MRRTGLALVLAAAAGTACSPVYLAHAPAVSGAAAAERPATPRPAERAAEPRAADAGGELRAVLGSLVWPLAVDRETVLSSAYGARAHPADGAERFHGGLDLRARAGTPVYAVADGRVVRSGAGGAYGNLVMVDHGAELVSLYGHNRENLVREGAAVRRGEVIALVGRTGNATGDHLHFELRWRGGTVDPRVVLPRLGAASAR